MPKLGEAYCIRFMQRGKILSTSQKRGSALALPMTLQNGRKDILVSLVRYVYLHLTSPVLKLIGSTDPGRQS